MTSDRLHLAHVARSITLGAMLASCWLPQQATPPQGRHPVAVLQRKVMTAPPVKLAHLAAPAPVAPPVPPAATPAAVPAQLPVVDPFAATTWTAPPAPVPVPVPTPSATPAPTVAPAPVAPPNPFVYAGSYRDGPQQMVILLRGDQVLLVQQGETIDNAYRLDRIGPAGLVMTYLPLRLTQSIPIADPI